MTDPVVRPDAAPKPPPRPVRAGVWRTVVPALLLLGAVVSVVLIVSGGEDDAIRSGPSPSRTVAEGDAVQPSEQALVEAAGVAGLDDAAVGRAERDESPDGALTLAATDDARVVLVVAPPGGVPTALLALGLAGPDGQSRTITEIGDGTVAAHAGDEAVETAVRFVRTQAAVGVVVPAVEAAGHGLATLFALDPGGRATPIVAWKIARDL